MEKKTFAETLTLLAVFVLTVWVLINPVSAHREGVPILKINGRLVEIYFDKSFSGYVFDLPSDADKGAESYVVNQNLEFELDISKFPTPPEVLEKAIII